MTSLQVSQFGQPVSKISILPMVMLDCTHLTDFLTHKG